MKADRLLSILLQLQARGKLTSHQLAKRLEVSMRTIHRDMEALSAAGVPVFAFGGTRKKTTAKDAAENRSPSGRKASGTPSPTLLSVSVHECRGIHPY